MSRYVVLRPLNGQEADLLCGGELAGDVIFGFTLSVEFRGIRIELATDLLGRFCKWRKAWAMRCSDMEDDIAGPEAICLWKAEHCFFDASGYKDKDIKDGI